MAENSDFPLITINFTYNDQLITLKSIPYKTLTELKTLALKKYDTINNTNSDNLKLHCYYLGRDLHECENERIASIFSNREVLTIKIMPPKKHSSTLASNINNQNYFPSILKNENSNNVSFNNIGVIKKPKIFYLNELIKERLRDKSEKNLSRNKTGIKKFKTILPIKNKGKLNLETENSENLNLSKSKEQKNYLTENNIFDCKCEKCNNNKINYYCRICNQFLCNNCKNSSFHENHLMIFLDKNSLSNNIIIYGSVIQTDIEENISNNNNLINKENFVEEIKNEELLQKNNEVIEKLENLVKTYSDIVQLLKNYFLKETKNKINDIFLNYSTESSKINEDIKNILSKFEDDKKKLTFKEFKNYFGVLNSNEVKLNNLNNNLSKYYLCSEINTKIYYIYDKINNYLNEVINDNNLFCLEKKYSTALVNIINEDKNDDKNDSKNDSVNSGKLNSNLNLNKVNYNVSIAERNKLKSNLKKKDTKVETKSNNNNNNNIENSSIDNNDTEKIYKDLHLFTDESSNYVKENNDVNYDDETNKSRSHRKTKKSKKTKSEDRKKEKKIKKTVSMKSKKITKKFKKEE